MKKIFMLFLAAGLLLSASGCRDDMPENTVHSAADMAGKKIGILQGTASDVYAEEYAGAGTVTVYTDIDVLSAALRSGDIDCAVLDELYAKKADKGSAKLTLLEEPLVQEDYAIAVAKENIELTEDINDALALLAEDGTLQKIVNGYLSGGSYRYKSAGGYDKSISLAVNADFPPYAYYDEDGNITGIDIDLAYAVCDILGVGLTVVDLGGGDIVHYVQLGRATIGMGRMVANADNTQLVDFTDTYTTVIQRVLVRKK